MINKQQYEAHLRQIFKLLLEGKTDEEIAKDLNISVRSVQRYKRRLEQRYGQLQQEKTDSTLFLECNLFKNRLLKMYRILEQKALDPKTSGTETAKCCEVAASLAIDVLQLEAEGIKAVKNGLVSIGEATAHKNAFKKLIRNDYDSGLDNSNQQQQHKEEEQEEDNNWKF